MLVIEGKVKRKKICRRLKQIDDEGRSQETEKRMRKEQKPGNAENTTAVEVILENITKRKVEKGDQKKTAKKKVRDGETAVEVKRGLKMLEIVSLLKSYWKHNKTRD